MVVDFSFDVVIAWWARPEIIAYFTYSQDAVCEWPSLITAVCVVKGLPRCGDPRFQLYNDECRVT